MVMLNEAVTGRMAIRPVTREGGTGLMTLVDCCAIGATYVLVIARWH